MNAPLSGQQLAARVAELEAERHATNEALDDAMQTLHALVLHRAPAADVEVAALLAGEADQAVFERVVRRMVDAEQRAAHAEPLLAECRHLVQELTGGAR